VRLYEVVDDGLLVVVVIADEHATGCHDAERICPAFRGKRKMA
jgi:hypothetical protein